MMPVLFVGHGSPMNAIEKNEYTKGWEEKMIFLLKNKQNRSTELWCNSSALPASPKGMGGRRYQQWFSGIVSYL